MFSHVKKSKKVLYFNMLIEPKHLIGSLKKNPNTQFYFNDL